MTANENWQQIRAAWENLTPYQFAARQGSVPMAMTKLEQAHQEADHLFRNLLLQQGMAVREDVYKRQITYSHAGTFPSRRATWERLGKRAFYGGSRCSCLPCSKRGFGKPFCHDPERGIMIRVVCPHVRGVGPAWVVISKTLAKPVNGLPQLTCNGFEKHPF